MRKLFILFTLLSISFSANAGSRFMMTAPHLKLIAESEDVSNFANGLGILEVKMLTQGMEEHTPFRYVVNLGILDATFVEPKCLLVEIDAPGKYGKVVSTRELNHCSL